MHPQGQLKEGVMLVTEGLYTRKVAHKVGSLLKHLFENPQDSRSFEVELVRYEGEREAETFIVNVRLIDDPTKRVVTLANDREIVRCMTTEGKRIDFLFGHESERELEPAFVFYEG